MTEKDTTHPDLNEVRRNLHGLTREEVIEEMYKVDPDGKHRILGAHGYPELVDLYGLDRFVSLAHAFPPASLVKVEDRLYKVDPFIFRLVLSDLGSQIAMSEGGGINERVDESSLERMRSDKGGEHRGNALLFMPPECEQEYWDLHGLVVKHFSDTESASEVSKWRIELSSVVLEA
jgi:hypothetical protein